MRSFIFIGLAAMAFAPATAQTSSAALPQPGDAQMQSQPGQMQAGATPADPGQMAATTVNEVVAGDVTSQLMTGAKVFDTRGGEVGTIEEVKDAMVVISTGTAKATLANTAFARGSIGPVIAMTRAQVEEAVKKAQGTSGAAGTPNAR